MTTEVKVAIAMNDGQVFFMTFLTKIRTAGGILQRKASRANLQAEVDRCAAAWAADPANIGGGVKSWRVIRAEEIPADRTYRNAMTDTGKVIVHDMPKAREIHRQRMRRVREPLLAQLDIEYQRADENGGNGKGSIAALKQALRDVTDHPGIEAARTIEELKAVWPEVLHDR